MQLWVELCSKCQTQNAVDLGDLNDCTGIDTMGMKCRKCEFIIRPDGWEDLREYEKPEELDFIDDGEPLTNWIIE